MSEQDPPGVPGDEPVIGGATPPPPAAPPPAAPPPPEDPGEGYIGVLPPQPAPGNVDPWESRRLSRGAPDPRSYGRDGPRAGYYDATNRSPGRTAAIYFFSLMALVIGGVLIFLLFRVLSDDGDDIEPPPTRVPVTAVSTIESPIPGARHPVNEPLDVIASVVSGEGVERIDILVSGIVSDQEFSPAPTGDGTRYAVVLTARFDAVGGYELVVRAITGTGKVVMSEPVRVVAEPAATVTPVASPTATIVVVTSLRTGPGQDYNQAGTLEPGDVVTVTGKTRDLQWLRIERGGGLWVRFNAIDISPADLERVPAVDSPEPPAATPTRPPATPGGDSGTDTDPETDPPEDTPTATATPEVPANAPDFIPSNAVLIDGGSILRITLTNTSTNPFSGAIVVRVEETPGGPVEQVLTVAMDPNGEAWVNFEIDPPIAEQVSITVTVDPDDAIVEPNEDNNTTTFVVVPPPEGPVLSLQAAVTNGALTVTISNEGTELTTNDARLVVSVPGETTTRTISPLAIPENESVSIAGIAAPRTGEAITITLLIDGVSIASVSVANPNVVDVPTPTPTPTPDATQDPSQPSEPGEPQEPEEPEESGGG